MSDRLQVGILVSGFGRNLQAIIDAVKQGILNIEIKVVVSDKRKAFALERAKRENIPAISFRRKDYLSREEFDIAMANTFRNHGTEWITINGFTHLVSSSFLKAFDYKVINTHSALLPSFPGCWCQKKAMEYGAKFIGSTIHFVDEGMDTGPIIAQLVMPILEDDTEETISARLLEQEHRLTTWTLQLIAEGRVTLDGRKVKIKNNNIEHSYLINPPIPDQWLMNYKRRDR
jgi:phosphoribosylglycinamide formyltransferase-1